MSSFSGNSNPNVDNYLLETLMDRLQLRAPVNNPLASQSLEDLLFGSDSEDDDDIRYEGKSELYKEESKLEREVIKIIVSGKGDTLKPNSGQAVSVRDTSICVGCEEDDNGEYLVWEWHGHIMAYTEEFGYSPEYIYGTYFQRLKPRTRPPPPPAAAAPLEEEEEKRDLGLRELIDNKVSTDARILHRNINAASSRK